MTQLEDIEEALIALWKGRTGASVQAIKGQRALVSLQHVYVRAQKDSRTNEPSSEQVALACRRCISDACDHYASDFRDPQTARLLLGIEAGGLDRRARRERAVDYREKSLSFLTHTRTQKDGSKSSYETRAISVIAMALFEAENTVIGRAIDYVGLAGVSYIDYSQYDDFSCAYFSAKVESGTDLFLSLIVDLIATRSDARSVTLALPIEGILAAGEGVEKGLVDPHLDGHDDCGQPIYTFHFNRGFERQRPARLLVEALYMDCSRIGFFVGQDQPAEIELHPGRLLGEEFKWQMATHNGRIQTYNGQPALYPASPNLAKVRYAQPYFSYYLSWG